MPSRVRLCVLVAVLCGAAGPVAQAMPADMATATAVEQDACLHWFDQSGPGWRFVSLCGSVRGDAAAVTRSVRAERTMRACDEPSCVVTTTTYEGEAAAGELVIDDAATVAAFHLTLVGGDPADRCAVHAVARRTTWDEPTIGGHQPLIMHGPPPTRPGADQTQRWVMVNHPDHRHTTTLEVDVDSNEVSAHHGGGSRVRQSGDALGQGSVCDWVNDAPTSSAWLSSSDTAAASMSVVLGPQPG